MEKVRYMISDAANMIQVESHVLRYWEEELDLDIPRNEMGHRYYTEENIRQFEQIKRLKEEGYQLKAIRMLVHNENPQSEEEIRPSAGKSTDTGETVLPVKSPTASGNVKTVDKNRSRLEQFQIMMNEIVRNAIAENNQALGHSVSTQVGEQVLKEMNYLMRDREEQEETRFRKLDETIRSCQNGKKRTREKTRKHRDKSGRLRLRTKESTL